MNDIKFETHCRLEVLFVSLTIDTLSLLDNILSISEVPILEKQQIRKYKVLAQNLNSIPSIETLKTEFPSLYFDDVSAIKSSQLNDYIAMFITSRKNNLTSEKLLQLSSKIKTEGMTEENLQSLTNLTKVDTVQREYEDVTDRAEEIYKDKDLSIRI